jgi:fumarate reductase flavoprotein subunit
MKRVCLSVLLLFVFAIAGHTVVWAAADPAVKAPAAQGASLAATHKDKKVSCGACHGKSTVVDDNETVVNSQCISCHGTMKDKGAAAANINVHKSHLGDINCTVCHSGHTQSRAYCLKCHNFDMRIAGGQATGKRPTAPKAKERREKADIVIIGAGATGFAAAITAHDLGAKVILLEKQPLTGGNSMLSAGGMNAAGTKLQAAKGVKDSPDLMFNDTMKGGKNVADPKLVRILAEGSAGSYDWLQSIGAELTDLGRLGGASVARAHRPGGGAAIGAHIIRVLRKNAADRKIDVRVNSAATQILEDKAGTITGVVVQGKYGKPYTIKAKAVVVAAGGFSASPERVERYRPEFKGMTTSNQPGATGDGIDLGSGAGAELVDMKEIQIHPTVAAGSRILITEAVRGNGAILVNHEGKRFVNELTTRDAASAAILAQKGKTAYLILDEGIRKSLKQIDGYFHLGLVKQGATIEELAMAVNVPAAALKETVEAYNKAVEAKSDAAFKRPDMPRSIATPKFYAIEVAPGIHYTMGGIKINGETMVIDKKGAPIKGLYAAGEVTGGVHGANRLGGNSIAETITFGRIAGKSAAAYAKQP